MVELSVSGVLDWKKCQRLWALSRYFDLKGTPSYFAAVGQAVHKTIELVGVDERPLEAVFKEQYKIYTKDIKPSGVSAQRLKAGLLCSLGAIDWKKFKEERKPKHELYFSKEFGDVCFRGFIDCLTEDGTILEWKTSGKNDIPVDGHLLQGAVYREMVQAKRVYVVYFRWRNGQVKTFEVTDRETHINEIEQVAEEISVATKKGKFLITGDCDTCWEREACQAQEWS